MSFRPSTIYLRLTLVSFAFVSACNTAAFKGNQRDVRTTASPGQNGIADDPNVIDVSRGGDNKVNKPHPGGQFPNGYDPQGGDSFADRQNHERGWSTVPNMNPDPSNPYPNPNPNPGGTPPGSNPNTPYIPGQFYPPNHNGQPNTPIVPTNPPSSVPNIPLQPGQPAPNVMRDTLNLTCADDKTNSTDVVRTYRAGPLDQVEITINGELCPSSFQEVTVLLVVDESSSMGDHTDSRTGVFTLGNDKLENGTCARLETARKIYQDLVGIKGSRPYANIRIGRVGFASSVESQQGPISLDQFGSQLNASNFCRVVEQSTGKGGTNYEAAFNAAQGLLAGYGGRKEVFFISDGKPTVSSSRQDPQAAGTDAAARLHRINNVTLYGLLLWNKGTEGEENARAVLKAVTGDSRVLSASRDELPSLIDRFPDPRINPSHPANKIIVYGEPYFRNVARPMTFSQKGTNVWSYTTPAIRLQKTEDGREPAQGTPNYIVVEALDMDGKTTYRSEILIYFRTR